MARIIYVMGPSASGKDSVLNYLRAESVKNGFVIAHRYITRDAGAGSENHVELSQEEFDYRLNNNFFIYHWGAHGIRYGIGTEVKQWLSGEISVLVNGSREHFNSLDTSVKNEMLAIYIDADRDTRLQRLESRGRESEQEIKTRLDRQPLTNLSNVELVTNNGSIEECANTILNLM